jgi:hypothetical protein
VFGRTLPEPIRRPFMHRKPKPHTVVRADRPTEVYATFADFTDAEVLGYVEKDASENELTLLVYQGSRYVGSSQAWGREPAAGCLA